MADYKPYFQVVLRPASMDPLEDFFSHRGRYANFQKETCFIRYICRKQYPQTVEKLGLWHKEDTLQRQGRVFVASLPKQPKGQDIAKYSTLWQQGRYTLPFHFENYILEQAFQDAFQDILQIFCQNNHREETIVRNFAVKMLFWIDQFFPRLFVESKKITCQAKFACSGIIKLSEYLFLYLLYRLGCDVLYIGENQDVCVTDETLLQLSIAVTDCQNKPSAAPLPHDTGSRAAQRPTGNASETIPANPYSPNQKQASSQPQTIPKAPEQNPVLDYVQLAQMAASVVMLQVFNAQNQCIKTGSGVIIHETGYILTNMHVVTGGHHYGILLEDEEEIFYTNELIKYNQDLDLAILRIHKQRAPILVWQGPVPLVRGEKVVAIGSPLGLFNTVSDGIISGFRTVGQRSMIQFTAPISSGSSGGALLNLHGKLIGIITAGFDDGQNLNLAVDHNSILQFAKGLLP